MTVLFEPANYFYDQFCAAVGHTREAREKMSSVRTKDVIHSKGAGLVAAAIKEYVSSRDMACLHVLTMQVHGYKKIVIAISNDWDAIKNVEERLRNRINENYFKTPHATPMHIIFPHDNFPSPVNHQPVAVRIVTELWLKGSPPAGLG